MRYRAPLVVMAATLLTVSMAGQPSFRSGTTLVTVNVSVRSKNVPVSGLRPADFELTDNGVRQQIGNVDLETVPVDVTLMIDTSGSMAGAAEREKADAREIAALLQPGDRVRLLRIDTYVHQLSPMQRAGTPPSVESLTFHGATAVYDALVAAMIQRADPNRRHLIVAMTDGLDTISGVHASDVRDVAARSEAVLHLVLMRPFASARSVPPAFRYFPEWMPFAEYDIDMLREVARQTGGDLDGPARSAAEAFRRLYEDFRLSYLLRYTPTGVDPHGWHEIGVKLVRRGGYSIRARKGYDGGHPRVTR